MKNNHRSLFSLLIAAGLSVLQLSGAELPKDVEDLIEKRTKALGKLEGSFVDRLERLKVKYTKEGNLDVANAIVNLIDGVSNSEGAEKIDTELDGTKWVFSNKAGKLADFEFLRGGEIKSGKYPNPRWKRLNSNTVLFQYGDKGAWVVFSFEGPARNRMKGYNSELGSPRFLQKK